MLDLTYEKCLKIASYSNSKPDLIYANGMNLSLGIELTPEEIESKMKSLDFSVFNIYDKLKANHIFNNTECRLSFLLDTLRDIKYLYKIRNMLDNPKLKVKYIEDSVKSDLCSLAKSFDETMSKIRVGGCEQEEIEIAYYNIQDKFKQAILQLVPDNINYHDVNNFLAQFNNIYTTNYDNVIKNHKIQKLHGSIDDFDSIIVDGSSDKKQRNIKNNEGLKKIFTELETSSRPIFTYGISFEYDKHIVDALKKSKRKVFVGYFNDKEKQILQERFKYLDSNNVFLYSMKELSNQIAPNGGYQTIYDNNNLSITLSTQTYTKTVSTPHWYGNKKWGFIDEDKAFSANDKEKDVVISKEFNKKFFDKYNIETREPTSTSDLITYYEFFIKSKTRTNHKTLDTLIIVKKFRDFELVDDEFDELISKLQSKFNDSKNDDNQINFHALYNKIYNES